MSQQGPTQKRPYMELKDPNYTTHRENNFVLKQPQKRGSTLPEPI